MDIIGKQARKESVDALRRRYREASKRQNLERVCSEVNSDASTLRLPEPTPIALPVLGKPEQELPVMAAVG
jgi:hypothetical protein